MPASLIEKIAKLRGGTGATRRSISALAKVGLIARPRDGGRTGGGKAGYEGYRLTYGGLDYLALRTHSQRGDVYSVGTRIGVGKESDITAVADATGRQRVLKIHRLGRVSFRNVRATRDYLRSGGRRARSQAAGSWMYLSRLAAEREFAYMRALRAEGILVPEPLAQSRHTVLMELVDAYPLRQIAAVGDPAALYADLMAIILRLARHGLIHGDFNEFNILLKEERRPREKKQPQSAADGNEGSKEQEKEEKEEEEELIATPIVIDFPQMVSMEHPDAEAYFDRDVACVKRFFERRFHFVSTEPGPTYRDARRVLGQGGARRLDAVADASGFTKKMLKDLEAAIRDQRDARGDDGDDGHDLDYDDDDEEGLDSEDDDEEDNDRFSNESDHDSEDRDVDASDTGGGQDPGRGKEGPGGRTAEQEQEPAAATIGISKLSVSDAT